MSIKNLFQQESDSVTEQPVRIPFDFSNRDSIPNGKDPGNSIVIKPITVRTWFRIRPLLLEIEKEDIDTYDAALVSLLIRAFNVAWLTDMEKLYSKIRLYANVEIGECLINKPCKMFREVADLLQDFKNDCTYCP